MVTDSVKLSRLSVDDPSLEMKLSIEDADSLLKSSVTCRLTPELRCSLILAYVILSNRRPAHARKLFHNHITRLISQRQDPTQELWRCYLVETKQSLKLGDANLSEIAMAPKLTELKLLILQSIRFLSPRLLNETVVHLVESVNSDTARELAIDFWLTRSPLVAADARAIILVLEDMKSPETALVQKVYNALRNVPEVRKEAVQLCQPFQTKMELCPAPNLTELLGTNNWKELLKLTINRPKEAGQVLKAVHSRVSIAEKPELIDLGALCQMLMPIQSPDTLKRAISNTLFNIGRKLRPDPLFIDLWTSSLQAELETSTCTTLSEKLTRFATALIEQDAYVPIMDKCMERLRDSANLNTSETPKDWRPLASAINTLVANGKLPKTWQALEAALFLSTPSNIPKVFERLLLLGPEERVEIWTSRYLSVTGCAPDLPNQSPIGKNTVEERYEKCLNGTANAWYALHQGFFEFESKLTKTEVELFRIISQPKASSIETVTRKRAKLTNVEQLLFKWAKGEFLATRGRYPEALSSLLQVIGQAWSLVQKDGGPALVSVLMDVCVRVSQVYFYLGNTKDAFMHMKAAHKQAVRSDSPARRVAYAQMLNTYAMTLNVPGVTESVDSSHVVPGGILAGILARYKDFVSSETDITSAQAEFASIQKFLDRDMVLALVSDCVVSAPPLTGKGREPSQTQALKAVLDTLLNLEMPSSWSLRTQLGQLIRAVSTTLSAISSTRVPPLMRSIEGPKYSYVSLCRTCLRSSATESEIDTKGMVVVSLNFEHDSRVSISRIDSHGELHVTLPFARNDNDELFTLAKASDQLTEFTNLCHSDDGLMAGKANEADISAEERRAYWIKRGQVEKQFDRFLHEVEASWFKGFKGLLSPYVYDTTALSSVLAELIRRYFKKDTTIPPVIVQLIAAAGSSISREEAEDLIYFIADSLQLHGCYLDYDEIDIQDMCRELRRAVNAFHETTGEVVQRHIVLIPNTKCQNFPWEALPMLRGVSVSRFLSLDLFVEAVSGRGPSAPDNGSVYYVLNPENNLKRLQADFEADFGLRGWSGTAGGSPTESTVLQALESNSWYVYLGHGAGQMCAKPHRIQKLERCANVILMGCSSARTQGGALNYDGYGSHTDYAMAGCPLLIGNLWDVADRDINRFCKEFLARVFDHHQPVGQAMADARGACVLRYCTGAAPVIYGLPCAIAQ